MALSLGGFVLSALVVLVGVAVARGPNQTRLILRLSDLPPGYLNLALQEEQNDETYCARLTDPEDTPPKLARFVRRYHPKGCIGAYFSLYTVPGQEFAPPLVGTGVMALDSEQAADAGWAVVPVLLGRLMDDKVPRELGAPEQIGKATRLFHSKNPPRSESGRTTSFLAWRSGNTIANVMVSAESFAESDRIAAQLAELQQAHIHHPTRYTGAERFDGDVPLDDPALEVPVYWLGLSFKPGHGLEPNRFFDSYAPEPYAPTGESLGLEEAPGSVLGLRYSNFSIDSWSAATWPLYLEAKVSRVLTTWRCTEARTIALPSGASATIYGGYRRNYKRCPDKAPNAFTAWAEIGGMHIVVNSPWSPNAIFHTPYDSFAGMEAIVLGLKLRPRPVY